MCRSVHYTNCGRKLPLCLWKIARLRIDADLAILRVLMSFNQGRTLRLTRIAKVRSCNVCAPPCENSNDKSMLWRSNTSETVCCLISTP